MPNKSYSILRGATAGFNKMLERFGVVTVMNARIYDTENVMGTTSFDTMKADAIVEKFAQAQPIARLDTLKIANVTIDGPDKTVTGGQYNNPLIKFGKTATIEMQDALGNAWALEALCGGLVEHFAGNDNGVNGTGTDGAITPQDIKDKALTSDATLALHFDESFAGVKTIIGDSFFIDQKSGQQVPVTIIFYQVLPTSIFNLTQDSEGDATVFDMNGDLLTTNIVVGTNGTKAGNIVHGVFYSILPIVTEYNDDGASATGKVDFDPAVVAEGA